MDVSDAQIDGSAVMAAQQSHDISDLVPLEADSSTREAEIAVLPADPSPTDDEAKTSSLELSSTGAPQSSSVSVLDVLAISVDELHAAGSLPFATEVTKPTKDCLQVVADATKSVEASADAKLVSSSSQEEEDVTRVALPVSKSNVTEGASPTLEVAHPVSAQTESINEKPPAANGEVKKVSPDAGSAPKEGTKADWCTSPKGMAKGCQGKARLSRSHQVKLA